MATREHNGDGSKTEPQTLIAWFAVIYTILSLCGMLVIKYRPPSVTSLAVWVATYIILWCGAHFGYRTYGAKRYSAKKTKREEKPINTRKLLILLILIAAGISYEWAIMIKNYGTLDLILASAVSLREDTIGKSEGMFPLWLTYFTSLIYAAFAIIAAAYVRERSKALVTLGVFALILIALFDLLTFGRIGLVFAMLLVAGTMILYFRSQIFRIKSLSIACALFFTAMLPRFIRGDDNFDGTVSKFLPYLHFQIDPLLNSVISAYVYYFSSIYALSEYFNHPPSKYTYGARVFAPIYNLFAKFIGQSRFTLIDENVYIPFEINIYSIAKDCYQDLGLLGIVVFLLLYGVLFGCIFRFKGFYGRALKLYMMAWLFYTPIYNMLSFGGFFISFVVLLMLSLREESRWK